MVFSSYIHNDITKTLILVNVFLFWLLIQWIILIHINKKTYTLHTYTYTLYVLLRVFVCPVTYSYVGLIPQPFLYLHTITI